ncbi:MAG: carboxylate-amine ligase [Planctomycetota bacterium]|jgi:carboxylate-amine ligase
MTYQFNGNATHTLGVEIELQLVDHTTGELVPRIDDLLRRVPAHYERFVKPEFMQSYCEVNTDVCDTVHQVEQDLTEKMRWLQGLGDELGIDFLWAGTHPFSRWEEQTMSRGDRYAWLMDAMQYIARRLVCFGLHVHIGVDSGDKAVQMCDRLLRHLPTLLAMSVNSPFWCGRDTGILSLRSKIMEALPTAGLPHTMRNWSEYCWLVNNLVSTGFIKSIREIWWDVRPHNDFGTVEIRIMDQPMNLSHTLGLVALTQALVAGISADIDKGAYLYDSHPQIAKQNKWHAARYGMDATFVDFDTMLAIPAKQAAMRLIERCMPHAQQLGSESYLGQLSDIIDGGTGAARQMQLYQEHGDLRSVVRGLLELSRFPTEHSPPAMGGGARATKEREALRE